METTQIRLENVTEILNSRFGGKKSALASAVDKSPVIIQRWFSEGDKGRNIGRKTARELEEALALPFGWLDNKHDDMNDLIVDPTEKVIAKAKAGDTHIIPMIGSCLLDHQFSLTIINKNQGELMLLSTDPDAYAYQLVGHNPNPMLDNDWGVVAEPNTALTKNEYALFWLSNGEILLRLVAFMDDESIVIRHPVTGEQARLDRSAINKAHYCYVGIPPSKIKS